MLTTVMVSALTTPGRADTVVSPSSVAATGGLALAPVDGLAEGLPLALAEGLGEPEGLADGDALGLADGDAESDAAGDGDGSARAGRGPAASPVAAVASTSASTSVDLAGPSGAAFFPFRIRRGTQATIIEPPTSSNSEPTPKPPRLDSGNAASASTTTMIPVTC